MTWDIIIIGGGPAGATVASILLKHRPQSKVLILEKVQFPRWHVGETMVSEINRTLQEMGVYDKCADAGFIRKMGATFVWGRDDEPWHMLFGELSRIREVDTGCGHVQTTWSWHVERATYDHILLEHARELGADVRYEVGVESLLRDDDGRVVGLRDDTGVEHAARWVVDATGQMGLEGSLADREMDPILRNVAYGTYWKGFTLNPDHNGTLDQSRAFIVAHPHGWSWVFPVREDLLSVGVVTSLHDHKLRRGEDPEAYVRRAIADSEHMTEVLDGAELVDGPHGGKVRVTSDFSYTSRSIVQPGLVRVGDAAGFVDPILSVGCFLGQTSGRFLAYALRSVLDGVSKIDEQRAMAGYEHQVRDTLSAFRELTYFFYQFNQRPDDWWAHARQLVQNTAFPRVADDREAFLAFATGFAAQGSVWREPGAFFDEVFFVDLYTRFVKEDDAMSAEHPPLDPASVLTLEGTPSFEDSAVPVDGEGKLAPATRVEITVPSVDGSAARIRRMHVPPSMAGVFDLLDGERSLTQVADALAERLGVPPKHRKTLDRYVLWIGEGLRNRGLVTLQRAAA